MNALPKIIFDPADHSYRDSEGKLYPSVTQILKRGGIYNLDFVPKETRDAAMVITHPGAKTAPERKGAERIRTEFYRRGERVPAKNCK